MISLYLRPDKTQLVRGRLKKDQTVSILHATEIQSYWPALSREDRVTDPDNDLFEQENSFNEQYDLSALFREIKTLVPTLYEEFYVVLPDALFCSINCGDFLSEDDYMAFVREKTGKSDEEVYYSFPIISSPGGQPKKTFFAIDRRIIDRLVAAAHQENISLTSIEPASVSFLRSCERWQEEHFLIEIFDHNATLISYSPVAGMFSLNAPSLARSQLIDKETANQEFQSMFALHDYTAEKIFSSMNVNVPFTVLVDDKETILSLDVFKDRLAKIEVLPDCVDADIPQEYQQDWLIPIGTLLQSCSMGMESEYLPSFLQLFSANILPEKIQMSAKFRQWKQLVKKYSRILIFVLATITFAETVGILYFSNITIGQKLQADYDAAQKNIKDVDAEIKLLAAAKKEHEYPMEAFHQLMTDRPEACGFSSVSVGNSGGSGQNTAEKWIHLTAVSADPLILQSFATALSEDEMFSHVALNKMDTDSSGMKMAEFTIGKGKIK